ncbi:hypothetical protein [Antribacter gilvus]|uniref:hypothetical protein n=1 Tax=Antribacter gilvus TaxID=2304675 RepID=UPI000F76EAF3|nr:hypothetical protein [Antribacter gilvus]
MPTTTIKIDRDVHRRLREYADAHGVGLGRAVEMLLDEREQGQFWSQVAAQVPDEAYRRQSDDVDGVGLSDTETYVARIEGAGR